MALQEIGRGEWKHFLDEFSRNHEGWRTTLEAQAGGTQRQRVVSNLPFSGINLDVLDGNQVITILLGGRGRRHNHIVRDGATIRHQKENGSEDIEIRAGDGEVVRLHCEPDGSQTAQGKKRPEWVDEVGHSGVYPMSRPEGASGDAVIQPLQSWGQGERGAAGYEDAGSSEISTPEEARK